ncbi:MAG: hypothetical protein AAF604_19080 [Acidobacteriota bacterium]
MSRPRKHLIIWFVLVALSLPLTAWAQGAGPRTMGNSGLTLDAASIGDQLTISSSDKTTQKMDLLRELSYLEPNRWQASSVTWFRFQKNDDGSMMITEEGSGIVGDLSASKKWTVEALEDGGWKATPKKSGGKIDLYLATKYRGEDYSVGAVVPKFDEEAYGAVYRGTDFLFFVVQKKHPGA